MILEVEKLNKEINMRGFIQQHFKKIQVDQILNNSEKNNENPVGI